MKRVLNENIECFSIKVLIETLDKNNINRKQLPETGTEESSNLQKQQQIIFDMKQSQRDDILSNKKYIERIRDHNRRLKKID